MSSIKRNSESFSSLIQELLIEGYTIPELAEQWELDSIYLCQLYKPVPVKPIPNYKREAYYNNEWDYGSTPIYKWEDISKEEKDFYLNNLKLNN